MRVFSLKTQFNKNIVDHDSFYYSSQKVAEAVKNKSKQNIPSYVMYLNILDLPLHPVFHKFYLAQ